MTVEVGTVVKTGIAGVAQPKLVLAGFRRTLFRRQFEVVGGGVGGCAVVGIRLRNSSSSSSPVVRGSCSHRCLCLCRGAIILHKEEKVFQFYPNDWGHGRSR